MAVRSTSPRPRPPRGLSTEDDDVEGMVPGDVDEAGGAGRGAPPKRLKGETEGEVEVAGCGCHGFGRGSVLTEGGGAKRSAKGFSLC